MSHLMMIFFFDYHNEFKIIRFKKNAQYSDLVQYTT